jgi:DNA-binding transcriptional LysR family regulator
LARSRKPLPIAEALDQDWIGLNAGAASMQQLQQSALTAGKPLKLRMQVRSFDAVCHLVASGLGIALLPKAATAPLLQAMQLVSRPLAEPWARRRLMVATGIGVRADDPAIQGLLAFLREPSQNTKAKV